MTWDEILGGTKWNQTRHPKKTRSKTIENRFAPRFKTFRQDHILQPLIPGIRQGQVLKAAGQGDALQALFEAHAEDQTFQTLRQLHLGKWGCTDLVLVQQKNG